MKLIPIQEKLEDNEAFAANPAGRETLQMTVDFYKRVGFHEPWIGYYVEENGALVGSAAFKGKPINGTVEIAYGTHEAFRNQGISTAVCKQLVALALKTSPQVRIVARTFEKDNFSARILQKNHFVCLGPVVDQEDGKVWEWVYELPG
jgi:[ribosomal protein S5]-alanine N-acetyltransferase